MSEINNYEWYSRNCLKIATKSNGLQPFRLRRVQLRYIQHLKDSFPDGIVRSISLKPRQAGWSTMIAGFNVHKMATSYSYKGIVVADKFARTQAVHGIYTTMIDNIPKVLLPMIAKRNESEVLFDNPDPGKRDTNPGLSSGFLTETAQDKDAGKSSSRQFAHMSEYAFYPFAMEIDQSVQNSIPLAKGTAIFKESTANGMGGDGLSFYEQWSAAERGDYIYKPFFIPWYEIEDYQMQVPLGFKLTKAEIELVTRCPDITDANLVWRRMKMSEIHTGSESGLSPEELFCQDFPSYPGEAFLSTGRPVFDQIKLRDKTTELIKEPPAKIKIEINQRNLKMFPGLLTVFTVPIKGKKYFIGADVAEGLEVGDASSAFIMDDDHKQVALFHGQIDPDLFGKVLVEIAKVYNNALIIPEINSMGHTTLNAIKEMGYMRVYMRSVQDELEEERETSKMGWRTTAQSKQKMINSLISCFRDDEITILDIHLLNEMAKITREPNGNVILNGKDRTVAACLAIMGTTQSYEAATVHDPNKKEKIMFETIDKSRELINRRNK